MASPIVLTKTLAAAISNGIALSQSPGAAALTLNGSTVTAGVATLDTARRVILTSGGNDSAITFTIVGTNSTGNGQTDVISGTNGGVAQSVLDFATVSSITPSAAIASTIIAGTNTVGSTPWIPLNWHATSVMNVGFAVELASGAANYTVQHTYDDPNNTQNLTVYGLVAGESFQSLPFNHPVVQNVSATLDGSYVTPIAAIRLLINSGTGLLRFRVLQSSIG